MSTTTMQTVIAIIVIVLIVLSAANFGLARLAEKRDPPIGKFTECDGVRLHCIDRGDPDAPCVVLFRGNGAMIQDFTISGLVDLLARRNRVLCFDRSGFAEQARRLLHLVENAGHMVTYPDAEAIAQAVANLNGTTIQ